jgi:shikimate kinase
MMAKNHIIYIIGFMGSGKTTAGKKLAYLLGWSFIDLDKRIEEYAGKTIPEIFSQSGEDYFRIIETQILRNLKMCTKTVISTGGGTPCYIDNMDYMIETGLTIYLKLTPAELKGRLSHSKGKRPLIKDLDQNELTSFIKEKLAVREKWYERSDITMDGIDLDINLLLSHVKSSLSI